MNRITEFLSGQYVLNTEGLLHVNYKLTQLRMKNKLITKQKGRAILEDIKATYEKHYHEPMFPLYRLHRERHTRRQTMKILRKIKEQL